MSPKKSKLNEPSNDDTVVVKKKYRKSKLNTNIEENVKLKSTKKTTDSTSNEIVTIDEPHVEVPSKKRGRKPKGGKVLQLVSNETLSTNVVPNIILHLKCNMQDIKDNVFSPDDIASFNSTENNYDTYHNTISNEPSIVKNVENENNNSDHDDDESSSIKDVMKKLNTLKISFHKSDAFQAIGAPRRSCCFWDTCKFDTPPVHLPKSFSHTNGYVVYGSFCSYECAIAYLMNEKIDTSVKFERCQMLHGMRGNSNISIKPAPNPHYTLDKFYGNLSINDYRKLLKGEQIVYVVTKPLTHVLPEIYEENNDFMLNNKIIPTNNFKPKKKLPIF
jgi:hypothetical protein